MSKIGVMICGHGSRSIDAVKQFEAMAAQIDHALPQYPVESGFLEFATPVINQGLDKLRAQGVERILAIPGMLFAAGHAKNDIPSVLNTYAKTHNISIEYGRELGIDNKMIRAAGERVLQACAQADAEQGVVDKHDSLLLVVGRGASDPDANGNVAKVTRLLWEGLGFGYAMTAYSGVTFPLVGPGIEQALKMNFKRIVVFPYFLFTGILVNRIYDTTDSYAAQNPDTQFIKAGYLNDHPLVLECFIDRLKEIDSGDNVMNCLNCKYREQVLGFEAEVGLPQESHHHHVEGIGVGEAKHDHHHDHHDHAHDHSHDHSHDHNHDHAHDHSHDHSHDHNHGHGHNHDHHHHPYPHNDHPMGPRSLPGERKGDMLVCPCGRWAAKAV